MNLTGNFPEPETRVKVLADWVLVERFDSGVTDPFATEIIECVLDELATDASTTIFARD